MAGRQRKGKSGIRLYEAKGREKQEQTGGRSLPLFLMRSVLVWILAVAWQRGFQSVFPIGVNEKWMYGFLFLFSILGILWSAMPFRARAVSLLAGAILAAGLFLRKKTLAAAMANTIINAYLRVHDAGKDPLQLYQVPVTAPWLTGLLLAFAMVPLLFVWSYVITRNRGRSLALLLLLFPAGLAAVEGYFISLKSCWLLLFSAGLYFAVCGGISGRAAVKSAVSALLVMSVLFLIGSAAVKPIESVKSSEGGIYLKARDVVSKNVIEKLADLSGHPEEERKKEEKQNDTQKEQDKKEQDKKEQDKKEQASKEQASKEQADEEQKAQQESGKTPVYPGQSDDSGVFASEGQNLKSIASFSPGDGGGITVTTDEKPKGTYYYPEEYGGSYEKSAWTFLPLGDEVHAEYSQYPDDLKRLIALCRAQKVNNIEDAARFIQQEFEKETVYDYHPGTTPGDEDFAEYFLLENRKGFCVHFATTATLMYRIFGYQARYVQGFAIPSSAFKEQADGTYTAQVTGEMGHAWCETYEEGKGWKVREHTLPYTGTETNVLKPAQNSSQNPPVEESLLQKVWKGILLTVCFMFTLVLLFVLQSAARRKQRNLRCRSYRQGRGILELYQSLYEIARFLGMKAGEPASGQTFRVMQEFITEITVQDWEWIQQIVWQTLYGQSCPTQEEHKRLYHLVNNVSKEIGREQKGLRKVKYRYIKSLG